MNIYNKFAGIYDELMDDFDYKMWFDYLEKIFNKYDLKPDKVLEMACGTGNLSYYFAKEGYRLTAFDISDEMLAKAYYKLNTYKNVKLLKQNMIDFNINEKFQAIISICDSINYLTEKEDLLQTFQNVYAHLEEGGIFAFDINSFYKIKNILGNNTYIEDRKDIFYSWENIFDEKTNICDFYLTFFLQENGLYRRFDEHHKERAYKTDKILATLIEAGFKTNHIYETFTFDIPGEKTERINFISVK